MKHAVSLLVSRRARVRTGSVGRLLVALLLLVLLVVVTVLPPERAGAQTSTDDPEPQALRIVDQTPLVDADGEFVVRVDVTGLVPATLLAPPDDDTDDTEPLLVAITVYGLLSSPDGLEADLDVPLNRVPPSLASDHPIDGDGIMAIRVPVRSEQPFDDVDRVRLPDAGVYPITIEIREGERTLAAARTSLLRLPRPGGEPADGAPPFLPPIAPVIGVVDGSGVDLDAVIDALASQPDVPATVVLDSEALAVLQRDPATAANLRNALADRSIVASTMPRLDPSALEAIGRLDRYRTSVAAERAALSDLGLVGDPSIVAVAGGQTDPGAAAVTELGATTALDVSSLIIPSTAGARSQATPDGSLVTVAADPITTELGAVDDAPAVRITRLLSWLALTGTGRPVILNATTFPADDGATLSTLLALLDDDRVEVLPLPQAAVSAAAADAGSGASGTVGRQRPVVDLGDVEGSVAEAIALLETYRSFYVDGPNPPERFEAEIDAALDVGTDSADRVAEVDRLVTALDNELGRISLPENQSVTLAARSVPIPLTIENGAEGTRQVMLRFQSDKIVVAEDGRVITVGPGTSSIDIEVEARSLGLSPLQVSVLSPDGQRVLSTTRFQVRSTAVPGLGLLISAVGLVLLAVWWYLSIRRKRSAHPSRSSLARRPDEPEAADGPEAADRDEALAGDSV